MERVFIYVVARDLGFAPNPFHGICSLATCKARIRNSAVVNDWVFGVGGRELKATGKCVFAMKITDKITYDQYWNNPIYNDKKPVRNGSRVMMVGDNIYHKDASNDWRQAHSHHSNTDGSVNNYNLQRDTQSEYVLLSRHFYYFGNTCPVLPEEILHEIGYENRRNHNVYSMEYCNRLINWLEKTYGDRRNLVLGDPINFNKTESHYSYETNRMG